MYENIMLGIGEEWHSMAIEDIIQPKMIMIDEFLRLRTPNKDEWHKALPWSQNLFESFGFIEVSHNERAKEYELILE